MPCESGGLSALGRSGRASHCCVLTLQDTQKGDIAIKMTWTSVELDADSDIKGEKEIDEADMEDGGDDRAPTHNGHRGKEE